MNKVKIAKQLIEIAKELVVSNQNFSIKTAKYDAKHFSDIQDDVYALDLTISSIKLLFHYLSVHLEGTNVNPWKDRDITNSRNEIRDALHKAKTNEVKKVIEKVLKSFANIKNEKKNIEEAIYRLKNVFQTVKKIRDEYKEEEEKLYNEWKLLH